MDRRSFLEMLIKSSVSGALSSTMIPAVSYAATPSFGDYKALVCIMLFAGNDSLNTFIPIGDDSETGYNPYAANRPNIKIHDNDLSLAAFLSNQTNPYTASQADIDAADAFSGQPIDSAQYKKGYYAHPSLGLGTNGMMPELAGLINSSMADGDVASDVASKVAIVSNVGSMYMPGSKQQLLDNPLWQPRFLFAHNHQRKINYSGIANDISSLGWAGRLADIWGNVNGTGTLALMNRSYSGRSDLFSSAASAALNLRPNQLPKFTDMLSDCSNEGNDRKCQRKNIFDAIIEQTTTTQYYAKLQDSLLSSSFELQESIASAYEAAGFVQTADDFTSTDSYNNSLFAIPTTNQTGLEDELSGSLIRQLEEVARAAKIGKDSGLQRQIFYVQLNGFDTHSQQTITHAYKLRELSLAVDKFQKAMEAQGMVNDVTSFTMSDFGRTALENGDGTDHAWGANHFVVGGAVSGGLYGRMPSLLLKGASDVSTKGRLVPTISSEQYYSTLLKWFGVQDTELDSLFPNLQMHAEANSELLEYQRDIGFLSTTAT